MSSRRRFLSTGLKAAGGLSPVAPPPRTCVRHGAAAARPDIPYGAASGDVTRDRAIVWSRTDRPARMLVEWSTTESMQNARTRARTADDGGGGVHRPRRSDRAAARTTDFLSRPVRGSRRLAQSQHSRRRNVPQRRERRATSPSRGLPTPWARDGASTRRGAACACTRRCVSPARTFSFIPATRSTRTRRCRRKSSCPTARCGETSSRRRNRRSPKRSTSFAEITRTTCSTTTCAGSTAEIPQLWLWDDHEVRNNWYPGMSLDNDERYRQKDSRVLAANARQAFLEYSPIRLAPGAVPPIYRSCSYGPLLEVFAIDLRTYRGPNTSNRQASAGADTVHAGARQLAWLKRALSASRAAWKVIASDLPIGLVVRDGPSDIRSHRERRTRYSARPRARDCRSAALHPAAAHPQCRLGDR